MNNEFFEFWGEPISIYTDSDAIGDGTLIDVSYLKVFFNDKLINRITIGAEMYFKFREKEFFQAKANLEFVSINSEKDRPGPDAWGIFQPRETFRNVKFWLVGNEISGYTLMLPSEY
jgi:hypothetical protein